ncbi:Hypothetical protein, putative [Bodo saltans]|uniref:Uncharacterized protein n=1 Tax=Bodo saltans TaxID=75058 RepID=A0A0S4IWU5_BODSA|nr:Hypothetical protein, putative [Bodo saltans]|eukprot:CUG31634.1 Hypothetical protein, putative [Bodo saltans]
MSSTIGRRSPILNDTSRYDEGRVSPSMLSSGNDVHHQLETSRRELLRATTQLSAVKDECEGLERKLIRSEQLHKTAVVEIEGLEDHNRRLRREVDELKRERMTLSTCQSELTAERDDVQSNLAVSLHRVRELEIALETRHQQQLASDAVHQNLVEQHDIAVRHNANLAEQRRKLEDDLRRAGDQFEEQRCHFEGWKHCIVREVDAMSSAMERSLARGAVNASSVSTSSPSRAAEDDLSLVSLIGVDHSISIRSTTVAQPAAPAHADVKPLFANLYQSFKTLHHFLGVLRKERREHEDHVLEIRQSCSAAERDLQMLQTENRHLSQRSTQSEVHVTRLTSQVEAACRQAETATQQHALLLQGVGDALGTPALDGPSLETQVRLMVAERNQIQDRCQHQQTLISDLKDELLTLRKTTEERVAGIEEASKQQTRHEVAIHEERAVTALQEKRHLQVELTAQKEHAEQVEQSLRHEVEALHQQVKELTTQRDALQPLARQVPVLEDQIHARDKQIGELRAEHHTLRQEHQSLRADHQQSTQLMRQECEVLRRHLGPYECSMLGSAPVINHLGLDASGLGQKSTHSDSFFNTPVPQALTSAVSAPPPTFCSLFDLLMISLRVLHGARKDIAEMSMQRRALCNELHEYNHMFGPLSQQFVTSKPLRRLLQFRRAVVVVLAANRLLRLVRDGQGRQRETFWSLRRGFGRVRLSADTSIAVVGGCFGASHPTVARFASLRQEDKSMRPQDLILPSSAEATDVPALMATLMEQVRVASAPPASAWCRVAPVLSTSLQGGLQRLYLHYGRPMPFRSTTSGEHYTHSNSSALHHNASALASPRRPSLVYPSGMLESQIASPPSRRHNMSVTAAADTSASFFKTPGAASAYYSGADSGGAVTHPHQYLPASSYIPAATPAHLRPPQDYSTMSSEYHNTTRSTASMMMPHSAPQRHAGPDEFSMEVLNVIRALDNKVAGALKLHHPHTTHSISTTAAASPNSSHHYTSHPHRTPKSAMKRR